VSTLVVGVGHPDRGDDAAGLMVARRIRRHAPAGTVVLEWRGDPETLLSAWDGVERAVVVDAVRTGAAAGTVHRLEPAVAPAALASGPRSSHGLGLAGAIALGEALGRLPRELRIVGVEGRAFALGAPAGEAVRAAVDRAASAVVDELGV